jgi:hypothetical protein
MGLPFGQYEISLYPSPLSEWLAIHLGVTAANQSIYMGLVRITLT